MHCVPSRLRILISPVCKRLGANSLTALEQAIGASSPLRLTMPSSSMDAIWTMIWKWVYITLPQILVITYYRVPPKGLWNSATFTSALNHQSMIIWTTQDCLTSSTGQWPTGGILMCLHLMAALFGDRSQRMLSPSWREWARCPSKSLWLGLCPTARQTQSGRTTWVSSRNTFRLTSLASVGRRTALEKWPNLVNVAVFWRGTICSILPSRTPNAKTIRQKSFIMH